MGGGGGACSSGAEGGVEGASADAMARQQGEMEMAVRETWTTGADPLAALIQGIHKPTSLGSCKSPEVLKIVKLMFAL